MTDPVMGQVGGGGYGLRDSNEGIILPRVGAAPAEGQDTQRSPELHATYLVHERAALGLPGALKS